MTKISALAYQGLAVVVLALALIAVAPAAHADVIYGTTPVSCSITTNTTSIENGQAGYLSWSSTGATSAYLSDGIGNVAPNGTETVRPASTRTYVLTVYGASNQATQCTTVLTVTPTYAYGSSYSVQSVTAANYINAAYTTNTMAPTVSLTQIPYTGVDWGTAGDAFAWLSIIALASSAAYLLYYFRLARV